jgi:uncharacterized membrane protein
MQANYESLARRTRYFVLSSYFGLLMVFTLNTLVWPSCNKHPNTVIWLIHMLPVLLFLSGVLKRNVRTHVWLSFISLGYFLAAVPTVFVCHSVLPILETLLIVQLFTSAMLYVRWRSRELATIHHSQTE